jgi:hypothetical protein
MLSKINIYIMRLKKYTDFLILEKFDDNIKSEQIKLGVTNKEEINAYLYHAHRGNLARYLTENGKLFTFGMLNALFKDARSAKSRTEIKVGVIKAIHRVVPMILAPFFPILAIFGYVLGTSRAFNKVIAPILADPGHDYPEFLKKVIGATMRVAEGDLTNDKDRFTRAFVVSDRLIEAIKPEVLQKFSLELSEKMANMDSKLEVPAHYIENELKDYLNRNYEVSPKIPLKD